MTTLGLALLAVAADITKEDLRRLAALRVSDEAILLVVRAAGPVDPLSARDLLDLRRAGLSARVIESLAGSGVPAFGTPSVYHPLRPSTVVPPFARPPWRHSPRVRRR